MNDSAAQPARHRHAIGAFALLVVGAVLLIAGAAWPAVIEAIVLDGGGALIWALACAGIGAAVAPRVAGAAPFALRIATWFGIGAGAISVAVLVLGLAGALGRASAWAIVLAGAAGWALWVVRHRPRPGRIQIPVSAWSWLWLAAAPAAAVLVVAPAVLPGVLWGDEPHGYDVVEYHLQIPREWHDAGRISRLDHNVFSHFPFLVEMHYLLAMHLRGGPYVGMYLGQYMHAVFAVFTAIAVYGLLGGNGRPQAIAGAAAALATPWTALAGSVAYNEAALMFYSALCVGWAIRAAGSADHAVRDAVIAGLMGGFACGVKLTAAPMVVGFTAIAMILARRRAWKSAAAFVLTAIVCFSPWWIRNLAWTGNPFFPQGSSIFADGGFSSQQIERWRIAHATPGGSGGPRDVQALASALHHQLISNWRFGFALVPLALIALFTRCDDQWKAARRMLVIVLALQVAFWLAFTHLQGRFLAGAIPLAALLIGTIPLDRRPLAAVAAIALLILAAGGIVPISRLMQDQNRVFGAREPALLWQLHPGVEEQLRQTDRPIALVGDARAFWWPLKSNRLFYRTVFDVDVRDGQMLVDAWLRGVPADAMVVIDPGELTRMARSYRGLGSVPPEVQARDRPYIAR